METTREHTLDKHKQVRVNTGFVYEPRKQGLCHGLQNGTLFPQTESHGLSWPPGFCREQNSLRMLEVIWDAPCRKGWEVWSPSGSLLKSCEKMGR